MPEALTMHPSVYYNTFQRYAASDYIFVAMPFTEDFPEVFYRILEPAITAGSTAAGTRLTARIVNRGTAGSPDIHAEIFDGVLHSRLVIADMSVQSYLVTGGKTRWFSNPNVAYEVGLAAAWRNPEDILLVHRYHLDHTYSFDVQNLRHIPYRLDDIDGAVATLSSEVESALRQSKLLADAAFDKVARSISPATVQFMHMEAGRAFPVAQFVTQELEGIISQRELAISELSSLGALVTRQVIPAKKDSGLAIIYQWTELGLRLMSFWQAIDQRRYEEIKRQVASVAAGSFPPLELMTRPDLAR